MKSKKIKGRRRVEAIGKPCVYCRRTMTLGGKDISDTGKQASLEHKLPRSMGGPNDAWNTMFCCQRCNNLRGNMPFEAFIDFARLVIQQYPDANIVLLRNSLHEYVMQLVHAAMRNKKAVRKAGSAALLRFADETLK